ncbi:hypothetical protein [Actinocorallia libanotica]|uniref:non-specific serine/threonine protein kinase n=1 Tax=Actinocorallia libanotica TaxID=46162 RepID=A0ABN1RJB7_9ACTN
MEQIQAKDATSVAYQAERYGERYKVIRCLAVAGQGYALLVEDSWCKGKAVLKGLWFKRGELNSGLWESGLDLNKARQQEGLKAVYQAMQLTQQAPAVIDVIADPSPTLIEEGIEPVADEYFVVMEFVGVEGRPVLTLLDEIKERKREGRPFTEDELIDLAEQLCGALGALHTRRKASGAMGKKEEYWIHADLKPENVLVLGPPAQYVLIDYDAAVVDGEPISTTTDAYAPPAPPGARRSEECQRATEGFDIYMLGATLAEALTLEKLDEDTKRGFYGTLREHGLAKQKLAGHGGGPILTTLISSCLAEPKVRTRNVQSILSDLARARDGAALYAALMDAR